MTKSELIIICRQLTIRVEELEKKIEDGITKDPNYFYLMRISEAFHGVRDVDKNFITRKACIEALKLKPCNILNR